MSFTVNVNTRAWTLLAIVLALPAVLVLLTIVSGVFQSTPVISAHLWQYVIPRVVPNTILLVVLVVTAATLLGTHCARLVVFHDFPLRSFFNWALLLPLALPAYVLAFIYLGLFDYAGPLQSFLRANLSIDLSGLPDMRLPGLVLVLTLSLFPYVFMLARAGFASQGQRALEVAASCHHSPRRAFWLTVVPLSKPWIATGALLVGMETLADFGAVSVFNYDTFTTAIYKTWFSLFSLSGALKLASALLLIVLILVWLERRFVHKKRYSMRTSAAVLRQPLSGARGLFASVFLGVVLLFAAGLPLLQLLIWSFGDGIAEWRKGFALLIRSSVVFGVMAAALVAAMAILLVYAQRRSTSMLAHLAVRVAGLGYALPGTILAVGVYVVTTSILKLFNAGSASVTGMSIGIAITIVLLSYTIRFTAVALGPVENGMLRISSSMDDVARVHGVRNAQLFRQVHWPLLQTSVFTAMLLVFVDVLKEMPITLMTRPFGWDTLSVRIFERTSEGQWADAAPAALLIVAVGLIPVILLTRQIEYAARR